MEHLKKLTLNMTRITLPKGYDNPAAELPAHYMRKEPRIETLTRLITPEDFIGHGGEPGGLISADVLSAPRIWGHIGGTAGYQGFSIPYHAESPAAGVLNVSFFAGGYGTETPGAAEGWDQDLEDFYHFVDNMAIDIPVIYPSGKITGHAIFSNFDNDGGYFDYCNRFSACPPVLRPTEYKEPITALTVNITRITAPKAAAFTAEDYILETETHTMTPRERGGSPGSKFDPKTLTRPTIWGDIRGTAGITTWEASFHVLRAAATTLDIYFFTGSYGPTTPASAVEYPAFNDNSDRFVDNLGVGTPMLCTDDKGVESEEWGCFYANFNSRSAYWDCSK